MIVLTGIIVIKKRCNTVKYFFQTGYSRYRGLREAFIPRGEYILAKKGALEKGLMCNKGETLTSVKKETPITH